MSDLLDLPAFRAGKFAWHPIGTAVKSASRQITVKTKEGKVYDRVHWAQDLSGEEQPAFSGWFIEGGGGFVEVANVTHWWSDRPARATPESVVYVEKFWHLRSAFAAMLNEPGAVLIVWQRDTGRTLFNFPALMGDHYSQPALDRNRRVHGYLQNLNKLPVEARR